MSKSKGNERLTADRRRDLIAAGYTPSPPSYPGQAETWALPGESQAWRSLSGAWGHYIRRPGGAEGGGR